MATSGFALLFGALLCCAVPIKTEEANNDLKPSLENGLQKCFQDDSIACVQMQVYRSMKQFFSQKSVDLIGGLSLIRDELSNNGARSSGDSGAEDTLLKANDVEQRENAIESFAVNNIMNFFEERSLKLDLSPMVSGLKSTARAVIDSFPAEFRQGVTDFMTEGRGKKKKILKALIPLLIGVKLKVAALVGLAYLGIALIAKKAILASIISIAISAFIGIKKLLSQRSHHEEVHEAHPVHGGGWDSSGYGGGHGEYGSHSSPVAHVMAYSAQKPLSR